DLLGDDLLAGLLGDEGLVAGLLNGLLGEGGLFGGDLLGGLLGGDLLQGLLGETGLLSGLLSEGGLLGGVLDGLSEAEAAGLLSSLLGDQGLLGGLLGEGGLLGGGLLESLGLVDTLDNLLGSLLGENGLLGGVLALVSDDQGLLGTLFGENRLLGGLLGADGLLGGLLGGLGGGRAAALEEGPTLGLFSLTSAGDADSVLGSILAQAEQPASASSPGATTASLQPDLLAGLLDQPQEIQGPANEVVDIPAVAVEMPDQLIADLLSTPAEPTDLEQLVDLLLGEASSAETVATEQQEVAAAVEEEVVVTEGLIEPVFMLETASLDDLLSQQTVPVI